MVFRWFTTGIFTFIIAMLLCLEIPKMLFAICSVIGLTASFVLPNAIPISNTVGILLSAAFSLTMLYGFIFGWRRLKVNEVMLEFDNLPAAFDGYRIVQLSDLHLGSLGESSSFIRKLVSEVNKLEADAVAFTGDLVNRSADEAELFIPILSSLKAKDGVYSVLGNHDYPYPFSKDSLMEGSRKVVDVEQRMGWQVLLNEHKVLSRNGATIPGSIGETSVIAILIGAVILVWAGVASWKIILSTFVGGALFAYLLPYGDAEALNFQWWEQLTVGGFCFGAVFMATDPVTSPRTEGGKWIFGFLIGAMAIIIRVLNPGYPEGMMLAILLMNIFAPLFDYCFVQANINKRAKRAAKK